MKKELFSENSKRRKVQDLFMSATDRKTLARSVAFFIITSENFGLDELFLREYEGDFAATEAPIALRIAAQKARLEAGNESVSDVISRWELAFNLSAEEDEILKYLGQ